MAKKKNKKPVVTDAVGRQVTADAAFRQMIVDVQLKMQKKGVLVGHNPDLIVLPVPAFIIRYLLQNTGLPLSCVLQIVGPEGCYKSTFAIEMLRWHLLCGGFGQLNEAETKPTPELRNSVLNWDAQRLHIEDCATFEDWQRKVLASNTRIQTLWSKEGGPGRTVPFCHIVDSLTGKASEYTLKNIKEVGHAAPHHPIEAREMADFMRAFPQELLGWPFTFIGVNHLKINRKPDGTVDANIPGGWALKFQCAAIIEMERLGQIKEFTNYKAALVKLSTIKNSYGANNIRINVRFKTWHQEDAPGVHRLHSRFEWWEAGILFLATGRGLTLAKAKLFVPRLHEVCDIHEKSGGSAGKLYWSKRLDVPSSDAMPAHDLGMQLELRPDVLTDLYRVCDITQQAYFQPGIDFLSQQEGHEHVAQQAEAVAVAVAKLRELQTQQIGIGPVGEEYPRPVATPVTEWPAPDGDTPEEV